jgi:colanic acid/amylovoran biosynthesis glycosyltransferase
VNAGTANAVQRLCYFTNVYPAPSHTTMRREIEALSSLGMVVVRVAARRFAGPLIEASDHEEARRTAYTTASVWRAGAELLRTAAHRPGRFIQALWTALRVGRSSRRGISTYLMYLGEASVLLRLSRGCDHIHANFGNAIGIAALCRQLGGPPVSLRIHGPEEYEAFSSVEWDWKVRQASFVAPISAYGVRRLQAILAPRHHAKVALLRCGVDGLGASQPLVALPPQPRLVCIARLEERKGHRVLLQALRRLHDGGVLATLTLVGDGRLRRELEHTVQQLGLMASVRFIGWADGAVVARELAHARLAVLPSFAEGLPIVLMEAFAHGRTVVATRVAGIPELVRHGETGWLVAPGDVEGLALALAEAIESSDDCLAAMARAGRERVRQQHDVTTIMQELICRMNIG